MEIYKKIQEARDFIRSNEKKVKKQGWNSYGKYNYFTPEQINNLVYEAEKEIGLMHIFELLKDDLGYYGYVCVIMLDNVQDRLYFTQRTDIPQITATNASQQIGGAVTFTQRYMLMSIYDIADNSLDFDDDANSPMKKKESAKRTRKPQQKEQPKPAEEKKADIPSQKEVEDKINQIGMCTDIEQLKALWENVDTKRFYKVQQVVEAKNKRKGLLDG